MKLLIDSLKNEWWVAIVAVVVFTTRELPFWLWVLGIILLLIVMFVPTDD